MSHFATPGAYDAEMRKRYLRDVLERVAWTFLQAFAATLIASGFFSVDNVTDLSILQKAGVAGVAAVLSLLKGVVASQIGSPYTAATLPATAETPDP
jgi:hypothetical protein